MGFFLSNMNFHFLTLFPDLIKPYLAGSLLGKAKEKGLLHFYFHQLRDYASAPHFKVDDKPFGGGAGMVMKVDVLEKAVLDIKKNHQIDFVCYPSPRGRLFSNTMARQWSQEKKSILFICGRYEGLDQRAIDLCVDEEISIGDYVLSGGELASLVMLEATSRFIPGVLGDEESVLCETHSNGLLEYPQYTRPAEYKGHNVPEVLVSGNHGLIEEWRKKESLKITEQRRPDLMKKII